MDAFTVWVASLRWLHILAGITWIGLLYYFNFVQGTAFAKQEAVVRQNNFVTLVPRALLFFRFAALMTWIVGIVLIISYGAQNPAYYQSNRFYAILIGGGLGTMMFINVWGIIWPNQKKIIGANQATLSNQTPAPPEQAKWTRAGFLASRTNTMMSIPMLFFMVAAPFLGGLIHR